MRLKQLILSCLFTTWPDKRPSSNRQTSVVNRLRQTPELTTPDCLQGSSMDSYMLVYRSPWIIGLDWTYHAHRFICIWQRRRYMFSPARPRSFVCVSVCKITQKRVHGFGWNVAYRQMSGHWRNWLTFEPDADHSPDARTGFLSPIA